MEDITSLKNKHVGKRIFVIGNGPSIIRTPLDKVAGEYSIAMNRISLVYERTVWRPTFFVCTTTNIQFDDWRRDIMTTIDHGTTTFMWDKLRSYVGERENVHYLNCDQGEQTTETPPQEWWSDDISVRVCKYGTSMLVAFQIAFYLGFKEIYVVGADLGFKDSFGQRIFRLFHLDSLAKYFPDKNHFDSGYDTPGCNARVLNRNMIAAHNMARIAAKKRGVKIFNATVGGNLDAYPRVSIEQCLSTETCRV